jgi:hypothetical protein
VGSWLVFCPAAAAAADWDGACFWFLFLLANYWFRTAAADDGCSFV